MKAILISMLLAIQLSAYAQIHTNPGGGPNPYGEIQHDCSNLDPVVFVFEKFLLQDLKKRDKNISSNDLFSVLEEQYLLDSINTLQDSSQLGKPRFSCTSEEKDTLVTIKEMYLEAALHDKICQSYLKVTKKIEILEKAIQSNGKK
jgi:hypothetical protein